MKIYVVGSLSNPFLFLTIERNVIFVTVSLKEMLFL